MGVFTLFKLYKWYQIAQRTTEQEKLFTEAMHRLQVLYKKVLWKRDPGTDIFLYILWNFSKQNFFTEYLTATI